jgi:hypothetical protein
MVVKTGAYTSRKYLSRRHGDAEEHGGTYLKPGDLD